MSLVDPRVRSPTAAVGKRNQLFCVANASRASCNCFQFGAYFSASSYFESASFVLPCFTSTSPHAFSGSAQCGPRSLAAFSFSSAAAKWPCFRSATPRSSTQPEDPMPAPRHPHKPSAHQLSHRVTSFARQEPSREVFCGCNDRLVGVFRTCAERQFRVLHVVQKCLHCDDFGSHLVATCANA